MYANKKGAKTRDGNGMKYALCQNTAKHKGLRPAGITLPHQRRVGHHHVSGMLSYLWRADGILLTGITTSKRHFSIPILAMQTMIWISEACRLMGLSINKYKDVLEIS